MSVILGFRFFYVRFSWTILFIHMLWCSFFLAFGNTCTKQHICPLIYFDFEKENNQLYIYGALINWTSTALNMIHTTKVSCYCRDFAVKRIAYHTVNEFGFLFGKVALQLHFTLYCERETRDSPQTPLNRYTL